MNGDWQQQAQQPPMDQQQQPPSWMPAQGGGEESFESLVEQVKSLQRADPVGKEQWVAFTDVHGAGRRDPAKHSQEALKQFLSSFHAGQKFVAQPDPNAPGMAEMIKCLQKRSMNFKNMWAEYCMTFGGGRNDPHKHDMDFHVKFFDFISRQASTAMYSGGQGMNMGMNMGMDESWKKRSRTDAMGGWTDGGAGGYNAGGYNAGGNGGYNAGGNGGWNAGGGAGGYAAPVDPNDPKAMLVQQVKNFQRMGDQQKELWGKYCDLYLGGMRDPARHDAATLQEFCTNHHVPPVSGAPAAAPAAGMAGGMPPM